MPRAFVGVILSTFSLQKILINHNEGCYDLEKVLTAKDALKET